jgi:hypothetical protein
VCATRFGPTFGESGHAADTPASAQNRVYGASNCSSRRSTNAGRISASLVAVAEQARGDRIAVGLVVDQRPADGVASASIELLERMSEVIVVHAGSSLRRGVGRQTLLKVYVRPFAERGRRRCLSFLRGLGCAWVAADDLSTRIVRK